MASRLLAGALLRNRRPLASRPRTCLILDDPLRPCNRRFSSSSGDGAHDNQVSGVGFEVSREPLEALGSYSLDTSNLWSIMRPPVTLVSTFLDTIHAATGAPWWLVLAGSTLAVRAALFPLVVLQIQKTTKLAQLAWKLPPPFPLPGTGITFKEQFKFFLRRHKELGVPSPAWFLATFAVQIPIFITWTITIRQMAIKKFPGFDTGGALWFTDLTVPIHGVLGALLPISAVAIYVCNVEISLKGIQPKPGLMGSVLTIYSWWLRLCAFPIYISGYFLPQGVFMYWIPNSLCTLAQMLILRSSRGRAALGLPALPSPPKIIIDNITDADTLIKMAAEHVARNNRSAAVQCLQVVLQKDPENATAYFALGKLHGDANQWAEGAELLALAASKAKQERLQISAYLALGVALCKQGKIDEGIAALKCVADMDVPEDPESKSKYFMSLVTLGSLLTQVGQKTTALEYLERAAQYDPKVGETYVKDLREELDDQGQQKVEDANVVDDEKLQAK